MWQMNSPDVQREVDTTPLFSQNAQNRPKTDDKQADETNRQKTIGEKTIWHAPAEKKKKEPFSVMKTQLLLCAAVLVAVLLVKLIFKDGFDEYAHQLDVWLSQGIDFARRDEAARFVSMAVDNISKSVMDFWQMMQQ